MLLLVASTAFSSAVGFLYWHEAMRCAVYSCEWTASRATGWILLKRECRKHILGHVCRFMVQIKCKQHSSRVNGFIFLTYASAVWTLRDRLQTQIAGSPWIWEHHLCSIMSRQLCEITKNSDKSLLAQELQEHQHCLKYNIQHTNVSTSQIRE